MSGKTGMISPLIDSEIPLEQRLVNEQLLLNQQPNSEWLKVSPLDKTGRTMYIPVGKVEELLSICFSRWWLEVKETQLIANSIMVTVRIYVVSHVDGSVRFQDGLGAAPIHTAKGKSATDFEHVGTYSVMKAAPAAKSFALKDAVENFGRIFGKDMNREGTGTYQYLTSKKEQMKTVDLSVRQIEADVSDGEVDAFLIEMRKCGGEVELVSLMNESPKMMRDKRVTQLFSELNNLGYEKK